MIRIAITAAAYDAICSTLPEGAPLRGAPSSGRPMIEAPVLDPVCGPWAGPASVIPEGSSNHVRPSVKVLPF